MPEYEIEATGEAHEYYSVRAESEDGARAMFEAGTVPRAFYTEVYHSEIVSITEAGE